MEISIFKEITTEGVITSIEENSKKYHDGLYADMNNLPERTMVKKGAAEIGDIIKELKTSRIAITKANTAAVNKEHDAIVARLEVANKPFTDLLDAYNVERKKVLDAEKERKQAILDAEKFENDHEIALLMNKTFEYDREQELKAQIEREKELQIKREEYADEQVRIAEQAAINKAAMDKQDEIYKEDARLANVDHVRGINRAIFQSFVDAGLGFDSAKLATQALIDSKIQHITINY